MILKIAIIDSGVNPWHSHVNGTETGVGLAITPTGDVYEHDDYRDQLGHGTAIAGVIREQLPEAHLYPVKIFYHKLSAPSALLAAALQWAIGHGMKIIHLSLGTTRDAMRPGLQAICGRARDRGVIVIAAARAPDDRIYPGAFESVIGACWDKHCKPEELVFHPGMPIEFGAHGRPRVIPGLPQTHNFGGASFSAARVTAAAGVYLQQDPTAWVERVRNYLASIAITPRGQMPPQNNKLMGAQSG